MNTYSRLVGHLEEVEVSALRRGAAEEGAAHALFELAKVARRAWNRGEGGRAWGGGAGRRGEWRRRGGGGAAGGPLRCLSSAAGKSALSLHTPEKGYTI